MVVIAWLCIASHILIWETIEKSKCSAFGTYTTFYTIYLLTVIFTPPCLMSFFGFLTVRNMKQQRRRLQPMNAEHTSIPG